LACSVSSSPMRIFDMSGKQKNKSNGRAIDSPLWMEHPECGVGTSVSAPEL
jgi:hypothetical protein